MALKANTQAGHTRAACAIWQGTGKGTLPIQERKGTASTWALPIPNTQADRAQRGRGGWSSASYLALRRVSWARAEWSGCVCSIADK